jgi:hypothetical protein
MPTSLADQLRARCEQLSLHAGQVAELAGINRSFVYDIMRGLETRITCPPSVRCRLQ